MAQTYGDLKKQFLELKKLYEDEFIGCLKEYDEIIKEAAGKANAKLKPKLKETLYNFEKDFQKTKEFESNTKEKINKLNEGDKLTKPDITDDFIISSPNTKNKIKRLSELSNGIKEHIEVMKTRIADIKKFSAKIKIKIKK